MRAAILCIPALDREAIHVVHRRLRAAVPNLHLLLEESAGAQRNWVEEILRRWSDEQEIDLIITIGATMPAAGLSADEIVPEATLAVSERLLPGLSEAMRAYAQAETALALLDRGVAGIRGRTLILNLPATAPAALLFLEAVVELLPAVIAYLEASPSAPQIGDDLALHFDAGGDSAAGEGGGLDADEFAAFLARRRDEGGEMGPA